MEGLSATEAIVPARVFQVGAAHSELCVSPNLGVSQAPRLVNERGVKAPPRLLCLGRWRAWGKIQLGVHLNG